MPSRTFQASVLFLGLSCAYLFAAQNAPRTRLPQRIDNSRTSLVKGNLHRLARSEFDRGPVEGSLPMERVIMFLKATADQQGELEAFLNDLQDPSSSDYHRWLSPEEFADRFSMTSADYEKIVDWLRSEGFTIAETARSRRWISFTGTAREVNATFHANIHAYATGGRLHYANSLEPTVPAALRDVVAGFRHLNDFRLKSRMRRAVKPEFTDSVYGYHFIAPDDFATIYDLQPLYNAGIDGTGQTIAVAGETDILLADIQAFRAAAGLPPNDPQVLLVPGATDPGLLIDTGDLGEADLDIQWAGAVARNARIIYVNSSDVFDSFQYAIDQNLAPVLSISYGDCETHWTAADISNLSQLAQQANAQGMTISAPSGDGGAADCEGFYSSEATTGLAIDFPASSPYVTSVGGTTLNDEGTVWNSTAQTFGTIYGKPTPPFWSNANNPVNGSALSYVPEITWNDTPLFLELSAGGGGRSILFPKPAWQIGFGDNSRDVPDISLAASPSINPYLSCSAGSCVNGFRAADNTLWGSAVGGTSVGVPSFAGIVALINQKLNGKQGNVNPQLYQLAASTPSAFHDITAGGNFVPCQPRTRNCPANGYMGYAAATGYDLATGLGSMDVFKLVVAWASSAK